MTIDWDSFAGESASLDFKSSFDPQSKQDWCELIKDIIAMSNSGGGLIVVGVDDDGTPSANSDIGPLLAVDPADVTNRIYSYTDQHFAAFGLEGNVRLGRPVAVIRIGPSDIPVVFTAHGGGMRPQGAARKLHSSKAAFTSDTVRRVNPEPPTISGRLLNASLRK